MVEHLANRFRALLGGPGAPSLADGSQDDELSLPGPDPEWDELVAWARESDDDREWTEVITRAKQEAAGTTAPTAAPTALDEAAEWTRLLARAKSLAVESSPAIASLSARLDRLATQVPDVQRGSR